MSWLASSSLASRLCARRSRKWLVLCIVATSAAPAQPARAQTNSPLYWNTTVTSGLWDSTADWWTTSGGSTNPAAVPGATNDAIFNDSAPLTVQLGAAQSALGLYFNNTSTTLLDDNNTGTFALSVGGDGITIGSTAGAVTLGDITNTMPISLTASQTWTNNSTATAGLTVVNGISETATSTLTLAGSGTTLISGAITNGTGTLSLVMNGALGTVSLTGSNAYSGATTVTAGTLSLTGVSGYKTTALSVASGATLVINMTGNTTSATANSLGTWSAFDTVNAAITGAGQVNLSGTQFVSTGSSGGSMTTNLSVGGVLDITGGSWAWGFSHGSAATNLGSLNVATGAEYRNSDTAFQFDALTGGGNIGPAYNTAVALTLGVSNTQNNATFGVSGNTATFSGKIVSGDAYTGVTTGALSLVKTGTGTQIFNGSAASTYSGGTTVNGGTLVVDESNISGHGNLLLSTGAMTLGGGGLTIQGASGITAAQTFSGITLTAGTANTITLNTNTGTAANLTSTAALVQNAGSTLFLNLSNAGTGAFTTNMTASTFAPWAVVQDSTSTGFGFTNASKQLVRDTNTSVLTTAAGTSSATDFTTNPATDTGASSYNGGSTLTLLSGTHATDSLFITAGATGVLDLGGNTGANALSFTSGFLGMAGGSNFTIQNGQVGGNASALTVNQAGAGTLTISGSVSSGAGTLTKLGSGTLTLSGSNSYTGATTVSQGTLNVTGSLGTTALYAGYYNGDSGTLTINTASTLALSTLVAGQSTGAVGTVNLNGGTLNFSSYFDIGNNGTTLTSTYNQTAGAVTVNGLTYIGNAGQGSYAISGGTFTAAAAVSFNQATGATGTSSLSLSGSGTFKVTGGNFVMGQVGGTTAYTQTGGTFSDTGSGFLDIGQAGTATMNISAGTFTAAGELFLGGTGAGTGTLTLSATGAVTAPELDFGYVGGGSTNNGTANLNGGTLTVGALRQFTSGSGTLSFNGGTLQASTPIVNTPFLAGVTTASVSSGGGTINNGGFAIAIQQPLTHGTGSPDGGLAFNGSGTTTLAAVSTYTGTTTIGNGTLHLAQLPAGLSAAGLKSLTVQLDASSMSTGAITTWGNSFSAGSFAGNGTVQSGISGFNGNNVVNFNGSQVLTNANAGVALGSSETIFYVGALTNVTNKRLVAGISNNWLMGYWGGHQDTAYGGTAFFGANPATPGNPVTTATHMYELVDSANTLTLYSAGTQLGSTGTATVALQGLSLGGGYSSAPEDSTGYLGEVSGI